MRIVKSITLLIIILLTSKIVEANTFFRKGKFETKYVTIHFDEIDDVYSLAENFATDFFGFNKEVRGNDILIKQRIDSVVEEAAKMLGIDLVNFKVNLELISGKSELIERLSKLPNNVKNYYSIEAYYQPSRKLIVMPKDNLDRGVFKHEVVHALEYQKSGIITGEIKANRAIFN